MKRHHHYHMPWAMIMEDRFLYILISVITTLVLVLMTVASCAIWPAVWTLAGGGTSLTGLAAMLITIGIAMLVVDLIISVVLSWFDQGYSFIKASAVTFLLGLVVFAIALFMMPLPLDDSILHQPSFGVLRTVSVFLTAGVLSFMPAVLSSFLGWLLREVYYVISQIR